MFMSKGVGHRREMKDVCPSTAVIPPHFGLAVTFLRALAGVSVGPGITAEVAQIAVWCVRGSMRCPAVGERVGSRPARRTRFYTCEYYLVQQAVLPSTRLYSIPLRPCRPRLAAPFRRHGLSQRCAAASIVAGIDPSSQSNLRITALPT